MSSENMSIWDRNKSIDPKYTKQATVSGQRITSFSLQSVVMMATKEFGPFGKGWGYEVETERFDEGSVIQEAITHENGDVQERVKEITHTLIIRLWYMLDDEKITCPIQAGHTPYLRRTKYGPSHDEEYYKKTLADAIKKSLSMLGFGADIFLGLMDDQHYLQIQESERNLKEQSELPKRIEEFGAKVKGFAEMYKTTTMGHSIKAMYESHKAQIHSECRKLGIDPNKFLDKCTNAYQARVEELKSPKKQG
ncbi:hypothetical protein K7V76_003171 [Vibrio fluvialis]|nr:hypothetical protein [Vibrio fluvialis]EKO3527590.1 hypothetical protein [Vibrio fluvialis]ELP3312396.1 hypothetical protein [Vibrio fluvialis]